MPPATSIDAPVDVARPLAEEEGGDRIRSSALAVIDELDRLAFDRGYPAVLCCDNGPELACAAMADPPEPPERDLAARGF